MFQVGCLAASGRRSSPRSLADAWCCSGGAVPVGSFAVQLRIICLVCLKIAQGKKSVNRFKELLYRLCVAQCSCFLVLVSAHWDKQPLSIAIFPFWCPWHRRWRQFAPDCWRQMQRLCCEAITSTNLFFLPTLLALQAVSLCTFDSVE